MANKNLIILITALNPSNKQVTSFGELRMRQYQEGLEKVVELSQAFPGFDYAIVDNTIADDFKIPAGIESVLARMPNLTRVFFYDNELGAKNKGSGVVVDLKQVARTINLENYDYCIYYEPRQELLNFNFFKTFTAAPGNYGRFTRYRVTALTKPKLIRFLLKAMPVYRKQINISLFSLSGKIWSDYLKHADEQRMAREAISMEDDLYKFLSGKSIVNLPELGVRWHNAATNEYFTY